ncbi:hypothetical protein D3C87_112170 [compost metagenome]
MNFVKDLPLIAFSLMTALSFEASAAMKPAMPSTVRTHMAVPAAAAQFKSYREWKHEQVQDAQVKVIQLKNQLDQRKQARHVAQGTDPNMGMHKGSLEAHAGSDAGIERIERQLRQEQYDLEIAKDLSVTDYFVGYLTKVQDKKSAINEVAGKLSPEEVAELMTAYANSVFGSHTADLPVSASNVPKDQVK